MAIQFMENFESFGTGSAPVTQEILKGLPWADVCPSLSHAQIRLDPVTGTRYTFQVSNNGGDQASPSSLRLSLPTPGDKIGVAFRTTVASLPDILGRGWSCRFKTAANARMVSLRLTPTGSLILSDDSGLSSIPWEGTTIAESATNIITAGALQHVEWTYNTTTGAYEVRVEGVPVLSGTHSWTPGTNIALVEWMRAADVTKFGTAPSVNITDVIVWDDTGSQNNDFVGSVIVHTLRVNGDTSTGWTSTGADDNTVLDEAIPSDADYTQAGDPPPAASIMTMADLPEDAVTVKAVQTMVRALKTDGGTADMVVSLLSNGSEDLGQTHAVPVTAAYHFDISELDPDTATAWTPVSVDAAELKINRTL